MGDIQNEATESRALRNWQASFWLTYHCLGDRTGVAIWSLSSFFTHHLCVGSLPSPMWTATSGWELIWLSIQSLHFRIPCLCHSICCSWDQLGDFPGNTTQTGETLTGLLTEAVLQFSVVATPLVFNGARGKRFMYMLQHSIRHFPFLHGPVLIFVLLLAYWIVTVENSKHSQERTCVVNFKRWLLWLSWPAVTWQLQMAGSLCCPVPLG